MDPDSAEATALMELAPTPVDITEITGAVFIFEREDSEPARVAAVRRRLGRARAGILIV